MSFDVDFFFFFWCFLFLFVFFFGFLFCFYLGTIAPQLARFTGELLVPWKQLKLQPHPQKCF